MPSNRTEKESRALAAKIRTHYTTKHLKKAEAEKKEKPMKEQFAPIGDVIMLVANEQPGEATALVNDLLSARVLDALQDHKQTIAKSLFAPSADALSEEKNTYTKYADRSPAAKKQYDAARERLGVGDLEFAGKKTKKKLKEEAEELVQEEHESVEDFVKRGGKIKQAAPGKAHGAQKKQTIKVPFRMGKAAR